MTIPVPPNLTTDAADAYRAGYAAGDAAGYQRAMTKIAMDKVTAALARQEANPPEAVGATAVASSQSARGVEGRVWPATAEYKVTYPAEQPGDREPTGLDGRGA